MDKKHTTYGGEISPKDFSTTDNRFKTLADIAARIAKDMEFDRKCQKKLLQGKIQ